MFQISDTRPLRNVLNCSLLLFPDTVSAWCFFHALALLLFSWLLGVLQAHCLGDMVTGEVSLEESEAEEGGQQFMLWTQHQSLSALPASQVMHSVRCFCTAATAGYGEEHWK